MSAWSPPSTPESSSDGEDKDEQGGGADGDDKVEKLHRRGRKFLCDGENRLLVVDDPLVQVKLSQGDLYEDIGVRRRGQNHVVIALGEV